MIVGLGELRPPFDTYEQFISHLWNVFSGYNDRRSSWNGTHLTKVALIPAISLVLLTYNFCVSPKIQGLFGQSWPDYV